VKDQRTPIRAIKVPDDEGEIIQSTPAPQNRVEELPNDTSGEKSFITSNVEAPRMQQVTKTVTDAPPAKAEAPNSDNLNVLVAEDDPINSRIIHKRLDRAGHTTHLTVNGEECATRYGEQPDKFDIILMDMQVRLFPFVYGSDNHILTSFSDANRRWSDLGEDDPLL